MGSGRSPEGGRRHHRYTKLLNMSSTRTGPYWPNPTLLSSTWYQTAPNITQASTSLHLTLQALGLSTHPHADPLYRCTAVPLTSTLPAALLARLRRAALHPPLPP